MTLVDEVLQDVDDDLPCGERALLPVMMEEGHCSEEVQPWRSSN